MSENEIKENKNVELEGGTYEIIRNRLFKQGDDLRKRLAVLNQARKDVFGSIDQKLVATSRITTENKCIPRDMVALDEVFIFGYNVHIGLRTTTELKDVFSIYHYEDHGFHIKPLELIADKQFESDFSNLYKYYRNTQFSKFLVLGPYLYMIFQIGKSESDIKAFKWKIGKEALEYIDDRSEYEVKFPDQHEFEWKRTDRKMYREGEHPHISIEDKVFVETIGGDLTIKVEDNTKTGKGIYSEHVEYEDQTLDDADIFYAVVGNLIFLKIKPYKEKVYRYLIFNQKIQKVNRVDAIENSCVLLPDDHGVIFPKGYYLQNGETKFFDNDLEDMKFERRISSPNGEDYLFIFYNEHSGTYILLSYNLIEQKVSTPIICHGYSFFTNGELAYFKSEDEPQNHHAIQIWQTSYTADNFLPSQQNDTLIYKIGNKDIVRAMAEAHEILTLIEKEDSYANLYLDIVKTTTDLLDSYYWLHEKETAELKIPLEIISKTASSAIDEYEKVVRIKQNTKEETERVQVLYKEITSSINKSKLEVIDDFVKLLAGLREVRGEVITLKELRYVDTTLIEKLEEDLATKNDELSNKCVNFLLKEEALTPYANKVQELNDAIGNLQKVVEANELEERILQTSNELEMLIEIVSNLKIEDATQTTAIIDSISEIFARFNQINAALKRKRKELQSIEGVAEFNAQIKLISQGVVNYLDISETPEKCEEYLSKLMIQLEELEGKFAEFEEFIEKISAKREEIYNAFEAKKVQLIEKRNKRTTALQNSAERIIKGIASRLQGMDSLNDINGYMASDLMVSKVHDVVEELIALGDTVKSDDIQSKLKSTKEEAIRQLKDKTELFEGDNIISFGEHKFSVNNQTLDLTIVPKGNGMYYHITGTNFFEEIEDADFLATKEAWEQDIVSENTKVYRAEYLAWQIFQSITAKNSEMDAYEFIHQTDKEIQEYVLKYMSQKYDEAYIKGVHDADAAKIAKELLRIHHFGGVLKYKSKTRAAAAFFWNYSLEDNDKKELLQQIKSAGIVVQAFPKSRVFDDLLSTIQLKLIDFVGANTLFEHLDTSEAAAYLFEELATDDKISISKEAFQICEKFTSYLSKEKQRKAYDTSIKTLSSHIDKFVIIRSWLLAFLEGEEKHQKSVDESVLILMTQDLNKKNLINVSFDTKIEELQGTHRNIEKEILKINFHNFFKRLDHFANETVPSFKAFVNLKKEYIHQYKEELRLNEFKPKVMTSFVRNQLINKVYLPIIGDNLAKQIGTADANKRTDLMGMLLLISPPGYGKTTLMEYIASRLGVIFLKINGPAIGHEVTSLDPEAAPNSAAREEIEKLNLGFEMGDNVMIYLDDIQHCNPEFLQKFISLSDGQRKIEGVYKGKSKTYDLRGKKVSVVMAGNPYTESGDKFRIPDMLANRADIYNLGDIIGDSLHVFEESYIENALTSNTTLRKLSGKSQKDLYTLIKIAETGENEGMEFESNHSSEEINDYVAVLKMLIKVRDIILKVNKEYIRSAAMEDQYRIEPSFKLQGSYRNMNKIAEKVMPIMNEKELNTLIMSAYESESQTLTTSAEANLLKFKQMVEWSSEEEIKRWEEIKEVFMKNQKLKGFGGNNNQMAMILSQVETLSSSLMGIKEVLSKTNE